MSQKNKTGKLFAFCCESSGIIKQYSFNRRKILKNIGLNIGLLFQITDDLIDFKGDIKIVGKPTKNDKNKGKPTLVNLLGYEETLKFANNLKKKIHRQINNYGIKSNRSHVINIGKDLFFQPFESTDDNYLLNK